ncbi:hypothetical protein NDU88_006331 [Pleurodeles waltl]|uniref:Uncharacterized protein n=1 Tax=Pleurodeles waltl TaxID=8319 RepID=A0AAV7MYW5_PLEWA|nr:hypothetical protein NDU88_006331 [Pleurodeles waltl]
MDVRLPISGQVRGGAVGRAQQHPPPPGSKKRESVSPALGLSFVPGHGSLSVDLCPVLCSPQAQGRAVVAHGGRQARHRLLGAYAGGCGSEGRGGGAPLTASLREERPSVAASPPLEAADCASATGLRSCAQSREAAKSAAARDSERNVWRMCPVTYDGSWEPFDLSASRRGTRYALTSIFIK